MPPIAQHREFPQSTVSIPPSFLTTLPSITLRHIDFTPTLPEYATKKAFIIENVLSASECTQLRSLAEPSVSSEGGDAWRPATITLTPGMDVPAPKGYRECGRIIWNEQAISDRIWARCAQAEGLAEMMGEVPYVRSRREVEQGKAAGWKWVFRRMNDRMRFLKYTQGQFFKRMSLHHQETETDWAAHTDGPYWYETPETEFQTHYTMQLYLNDGETPADEALVGGVTAFLSRDRKRRLDVNPKTGSALIFQHEGLLHEGALVERGEKYTMRTDVVYELIKTEG